MIYGSPCHVESMTKRFLAMSETDMHLCYLMIKNHAMIKHHPCVDLAYQKAKNIIKEKKR